MKLIIAIDDQPLSSVELDPARWSDKEYIAAVCRLLKIKYRKQIEHASLSFYIQVPSRMSCIR